MTVMEKKSTHHTLLLNDKKALITGGSRGLGAALCDRFAREGADVAFNFSSDEESAQKTLARVGSHGKRCSAFQTSVLDETGISRMVEQIEKNWGAIDILVNNAGITQPLPIALMDSSDWDQVMDINVKGNFLVTRSALRGMIRRRQGVILNIGSLAGERPIESPAHYAASKAAIRGFTEALCKEMAPYGIRVNCLAPGLLDEGVGHNLPDHRVKEYIRHVPLGRLGTVDEAAKFAAFLVSDQNSYMNGETILMAGGL